MSIKYAVKSVTGIASAAGALTLAALASPVFAATSGAITNPLAGNSSSVGSFVNGVMSWALAAIASIAGAWFLFHLYKAILGFMAGANHAAKRDEAKSHLIHVAISGVMLGAAGVIAGALFNLGGTFH